METKNEVERPGLGKYAKNGTERGGCSILYRERWQRRDVGEAKYQLGYKWPL